MIRKEKADPLLYAVTGYLLLTFFYILIVVQPFLYAHQTQPPFLRTQEFAKSFLQFPGEPAEYIANFLMQFFFRPIAGTITFFLFICTFYLLVLALLNRVSKLPVNPIPALFPVTFMITLVNNYNLPFSVVVSVFLLTASLLLITVAKNSLTKALVLFLFSAFMVYYLAGSGYFLVFTLSAVFLPCGSAKTHRFYFVLFAGLLSFVLPFLASNYVFAIPPKQVWLHFYQPEAYFMDYKPSVVFILFIVSVPLAIALTKLTRHFAGKKRPLIETENRKLFSVATGFALLVLFAAGSHYFSFHPDEKKKVAADYYCYTNNPEKTALNAKNLKDYSFKANVNYNLVMSKTGQLNEKVFDFMQITGSDAIHPDIEFQAEMSFVAADFYYNLGFITEARHWAYETLVFYPNNRRTLQLLVKIHLVTGEYPAARQYLRLLKSGFGSTKFISEFEPVVTDTTLFGNIPELLEKRSFIPAEGELSPFFEERLKQLLAANQQNKKAYEFLMLYYMLESDAQKFVELYKNAGQYYSQIPIIYEEALLSFGEKYELTEIGQFQISGETKARFDDFTKKRDQYKNSIRTARNKLYKEFGNSYFYYREFVFLNVIKPDIIDDDSDYPAI